MSERPLGLHTALRSGSSDSPLQQTPSFSLSEQLRFFFKPIQFHLEPADLLEKLGLKLIPALLHLLSSVGKKIRERLQKMPAPLPNLVGMDTEFARYLSDGLFPFGSFECHFGLECGVMLSAHVDHSTIPLSELWQAKMHLNPLSSFRGPPQSSQIAELAKPIIRFCFFKIFLTTSKAGINRFVLTPKIKKAGQKPLHWRSWQLKSAIC